MKLTGSLLGCLLCLAVVSLGARISNKSSRVHGDIGTLITGYGYPVEEYTVTTTDGYILTLYRIPQRAKKHNEDVLPTRPVLLMHNFMSSAEDFVYGGPDHGLALVLSNFGYDVYLGNVRGSKYGVGHTTLNPNKDAAFWNFCWNEIGTKDLPIIIDEVLRISGSSQVDYIGHMEGATAFLVLASQMDEYNDKVNRSIALGPIALLNHSTHPMLRMVSKHLSDKSWIMKNLGINAFRPSPEVLEEVQNDCNQLRTDLKDICNDYYFLYNGFNSTNFNETTIANVLSRLPPVGGSVMEVLAFAEVLKEGKFVKFDDTTFRPHHHQQQQQKRADLYEYDLSCISVPMGIFYTPNDMFSSVEDMETLISKIPNVYHQQNVKNLNINMDLIYANGVGNDIYQRINELLQMLQPIKKSDDDDSIDNEYMNDNRRNSRSD